MDGPSPRHLKPQARFARARAQAHTHEPYTSRLRDRRRKNLPGGYTEEHNADGGGGVVPGSILFRGVRGAWVVVNPGRKRAY